MAQAAIQHETKLPSLPSFTTWDTVEIDEGDIDGARAAASLKRRFEGLEVLQLRSAVGRGAAGPNKRLRTELADLAREPLHGVSLNAGADASDDPSVVHARVAGPVHIHRPRLC